MSLVIEEGGLPSDFHLGGAAGAGGLFGWVGPPNIVKAARFNPAK